MDHHMAAMAVICLHRCDREEASEGEGKQNSAIIEKYTSQYSSAVYKCLDLGFVLKMIYKQNSSKSTNQIKCKIDKS